jgi:type II restriction enzyme
LIVDGAYKVLYDKLRRKKVPNFFLLNYNTDDYFVTNFLVIPKHFFTYEVIQKRKPLSCNARRANWIGSNILINHIPNSGKIYYVKNKKEFDKDIVLEKWGKTLFLIEQDKLKGWTLDVMRCLDEIDKEEFDIDDVYKFEKYLQQKHPNNKHIKDKIRQQLQYLRDKGYIEFIQKGKYRKK